MPVTQIQHPLVQHHLTRLREKSTPPAEFRALLQLLTALLVGESTKDLAVGEVEIQTPLTAMTGYRLRQRIGLVPILRAGLGMVDPILNLIPTAEVWHLGLYRDEQTAKPVEYYSKLPPGRPVEVAMILDPMLATGGSASRAGELLSRWGVQRLKLLSIIAAPEGMEELRARCPQIDIHVCAIDERLNERKFIVPGLGDAGDRAFNTLLPD